MYGGTNFLFFLVGLLLLWFSFQKNQIPLFSLVCDYFLTHDKSQVLVGLVLYLDDRLRCLLPAALFCLLYPAGYFQSSALE